MGNGLKIWIPVIVVAIFSITVVSISAEESLIPSWIKNTAGFWVDGDVSDKEFLSTMEWLIENNFIQVSSFDEWKAEADKLYRENQQLKAEIEQFGTLTTTSPIKSAHLKLNADEFVLPTSRGTTKMVQINGYVDNYFRGTNVYLIVEKPGSDPETLKLVASDGAYTAQIILQHDSPKGEYVLRTQYQGVEVDATSFIVTDQFASKEPAPSGPVPMPYPVTTTAIPSWIKTTTGFWVNSDVSNKEFLSTMEWLIENNFIQVSSFDEWKAEADKLYKENQQLKADKLYKENQQLKAEIDYLEEQLYYEEETEFYLDDSDSLENGCDSDFPYLWSDGYCYTIPEPNCPADFPYLWLDGRCYTVSEPNCPADRPYSWSDGFCYKSPEYLDNGCHSNFPYLWSDGYCHTVPESTYDEPVESAPRCDPSYPDVCIPPYPPDLDCGEIGYSNFRVVGNDPHGFDADHDGIGCEVGSPSSTQPSCDPSYPDVCIPPYPPDLDCGEIGYSNFRVVGNDPHGFDRDNDGIGCES